MSNFSGMERKLHMLNVGSKHQEIWDMPFGVKLSMGTDPWRNNSPSSPPLLLFFLELPKWKLSYLPIKLHYLLIHCRITLSMFHPMMGYEKQRLFSILPVSLLWYAWVYHATPKWSFFLGGGDNINSWAMMKSTGNVTWSVKIYYLVSA